jgi:hypothetical protein
MKQFRFEMIPDLQKSKTIQDVVWVITLGQQRYNAFQWRGTNESNWRENYLKDTVAFLYSGRTRFTFKTLES